MTLPTIGEATDPALAALGRRLGEVGFTLEAVLAHTRASVLAGLPLVVEADRPRRPEARGLAALIELCVCGQPVPLAALDGILGAADLALLAAVGVLAAGDPLRAQLALVPVARQGGHGSYRVTGPSLLVVHDRHDAAAETDAVMPPDTSSETLLRCLPARGESWLDIGTGSGLVALMAARQGARVVAADVNPRAVQAVALAAALNGLTVDTVVSDLTAAVPRRRYDVVTFNAPLMFGTRHAATWRSSPEGIGLMTRFFAELPGVLAETPAAEALVHGQLPHDDQLVIHRLGLDPIAWRVLSVRYYLEDDHAQGVLWLARGGAEPWSREVHTDLSLDQPFVDRPLLDELISQQEMPGARPA